MDIQKHTHCATTDIALLELPEPISFCACLVYLAQGNVHEVVAVDKVTIERLAILQFDQLESHS